MGITFEKCIYNGKLLQRIATLPFNAASYESCLAFNEGLCTSVGCSLSTLTSTTSSLLHTKCFY